MKRNASGPRTLVLFSQLQSPSTAALRSAWDSFHQRVYSYANRYPALMWPQIWLALVCACAGAPGEPM